MRLFDYDLKEKTLVMGILNVTPDSFSDGGRFNSLDKALKHAKKMVDEGADIIDIGGESTRPGAKSITSEEEIKRVLPILKKIVRGRDIPISIDTYKSEVAEECLNNGASMINDITSLRGDEKLASVVKDFNVPICLMHMKGTPGNMQKNPYYEDVVKEIKNFLEKQSKFAMKKGIKKEDIIVDPGIGFGKRTGSGIEDNCTIIENISKFKKLGYPVMIGASRKTFIGNISCKKILSADERLEGSIAAAIVSSLNGADIIRVHDVKETVRALNVLDCIKKSDR
jgi:dihydropteroate synthase